MTWRHYHEATKHSVESLRRTARVLDWANMPDPFRHYEGAPLLDLPANAASPETAALEVLRGTKGKPGAGDGAAFLSELLFHSAAISASKRVAATGGRYALRVNPSSGNLHPTEFHFRTRGLTRWPDGLYHYRPSAHMAEQRAVGDIALIEVAGTAAEEAPIVFLLTSIAWREAWKYGARAYRYCLHDIGHAWESLALAARAMGCDTKAYGAFPDGGVAQSARLAADEWPMLIVELRGDAIPQETRASSGGVTWQPGEANPLSPDVITYPLIEGIHEATSTMSGDTAPQPAAIPRPIDLSHGAIHPPRPFGETVRNRRSALDFIGGTRSISQPQLSTMLAAATQPLRSDFGAGSHINLYVYVHRVEGLAPGVYTYSAGADAALEPFKPGDQRVMAAALSLGQELAGNACVAFTMAGDIERATSTYGDRGYRYVFFEAGVIGQRLYVAAEALGLGATGIGAFYDEEVHAYLNITPHQGQVVYHFAIGYPVLDPRLDA